MTHLPSRTRRTVVLLAAITSGFLISPPANAAPGDLGGPATELVTDGVTRTELQRFPAPLAGFDIVQTRVEIPVGMESGLHSHPGPEIGYLIQGDVEMVFHDQPALHLQGGDPFHIPADTVHNARNVGTIPTLMLSSYVIDASQPLATPR